jgi:hypothetical protein
MTQNPLPTFVIIGAQKSATRWLRSNLGQHPQIFTAPSELHFWNEKWKVRDLGLERYRQQFAGWKGEPITGEATPGYMFWRHHPRQIARRMNEGLPDARLIAILRNPIDRANSAMLHHVRRERIQTGVRLVDLVRARRPPEKDWFCLVSGGWYAASLAPFVEHFGDQLLVLLHDDVSHDPAGVYEAALRHVGAEPGYVPSRLSRVVFSNRKAKAMHQYELSPDDRLEMWEYFRDDVARLEEMFAIDLSRWTPHDETIAASGTAG